jgi:hypothetical protein
MSEHYYIKESISAYVSLLLNQVRVNHLPLLSYERSKSVTITLRDDIPFVVHACKGGPSVNGSIGSTGSNEDRFKELEVHLLTCQECSEDLENEFLIRFLISRYPNEFRAWNSPGTH